jgi:hypothetical protein
LRSLPHPNASNAGNKLTIERERNADRQAMKANL